MLVLRDPPHPRVASSSPHATARRVMYGPGVVNPYWCRRRARVTAIAGRGDGMGQFCHRDLADGHNKRGGAERCPRVRACEADDTGRGEKVEQDRHGRADRAGDDQEQISSAERRCDQEHRLGSEQLSQHLGDLRGLVLTARPPRPGVIPGSGRARDSCRSRLLEPSWRRGRRLGVTNRFTGHDGEPALVPDVRAIGGAAEAGLPAPVALRTSTMCPACAGMGQGVEISPPRGTCGAWSAG